MDADFAGNFIDYLHRHGKIDDRLCFLALCLHDISANKNKILNIDLL